MEDPPLSTDGYDALGMSSNVLSLDPVRKLLRLCVLCALRAGATGLRFTSGPDEADATIHEDRGGAWVEIMAPPPHLAPYVVARLLEDFATPTVCRIEGHSYELVAHGTEREGRTCVDLRWVSVMRNPRPSECRA